MALFGKGGKTADPVTLLKSGDFKGAIKLLEKKLRQNPVDFTTRLRLAEAFEGAGRKDDAALIYIEEGEASLSGGSRAQGVALIRKAAKLKPEDSALAAKLAQLDSAPTQSAASGSFSFDMDMTGEGEAGGGSTPEPEIKAEAPAPGLGAPDFAGPAEHGLNPNATDAPPLVRGAVDMAEPAAPVLDAPAPDVDATDLPEPAAASPDDGAARVQTDFSPVSAPLHAPPQASSEEAPGSVTAEGVPGRDMGEAAAAAEGTGRVSPEGTAGEVQAEEAAEVDAVSGPSDAAPTLGLPEEVAQVQEMVEVIEVSEVGEVLPEAAGEDLPAEAVEVLDACQPISGDGKAAPVSEDGAPGEEPEDLPLEEALPAGTVHEAESGPSPASPPPSRLLRPDDTRALMRELFPGISPEESAELGATLTTRKLLTGETLIREGDEGDSLFLVMDGTLEASGRFENMNLRLATLGRCNVLGEVAFLKQVPRTATVLALEPSTVLELSREAVVKRFKDRPELLNRLEAILEERVESTIQALKQRWESD